MTSQDCSRPFFLSPRSVRIHPHVEAAKRAGLPETSESIRHPIAQILEEMRGTSRDDTLFGVDDLSGAFAVGRHLKTLTQNARAAAPSCGQAMVLVDIRPTDAA